MMSVAVSFPDWKTTNWLPPTDPLSATTYPHSQEIEALFVEHNSRILSSIPRYRDIVNSHAIEIDPKRRFYMSRDILIRREKSNWNLRFVLEKFRIVEKWTEDNNKQGKRYAVPSSRRKRKKKGEFEFESSSFSNRESVYFFIRESEKSGERNTFPDFRYNNPILDYYIRWMKLPPPVIKLPPANALARAQTHYCSWATNSWRTRV